jgi:hypothetical protein
LVPITGARNPMTTTRTTRTTTSTGPSRQNRRGRHGHRFRRGHRGGNQESRIKNPTWAGDSRPASRTA